MSAEKPRVERRQKWNPTCDVPCKPIQDIFEKKAFVPFSWFAWVVGGVITVIGGMGVVGLFLAVMLFNNQKDIKSALIKVDKTVAVHTIQMEDVKDGLRQVQYELRVKNGRKKAKIR